MKRFSTVTNIYFVGIGGIGMSAIAEILINQGFSVSGSDAKESDNTIYLKNLGAEIFIGHKAENIQNAEVVVYSSAVNPEENPETNEAVRLGIPIIKRAVMLAEVARLNYCLAIAGTHGKTTTTSMLGLILIKAGIDPTVIVGGRLRDFGGTNARLGKGEWTVVEADEYDRSFLQLSPAIAVINNIEADHLDIYKDLDDIKQTFTQFANMVPFYGFAAVGIDDFGVKDILSAINRKVVTFGLSKHSDYQADNIKFEDKTHFQVKEFGKLLGEITISVPGIHNIKNALASVTVARQMGIDFDVIQSALSEFSGVYRRFDIKGEAKGILVVDDYAHHPSEVAATLEAASKSYNRRVVAAFQPHTFSRTKEMYREFAQSFDNADVLIVTGIYPARELPIPGIIGKMIADEAINFGHKNVHYYETLQELEDNLGEILNDGDLFITLGAGNIVNVADNLFDRLKNQNSK